MKAFSLGNITLTHCTEKTAITCLFGAVGWGADEAGHPFEEQTKKAPLAERSGCYQRMSMTAPISILAS